MRLRSQSWLNLSIGLLLGFVVVNGAIAFHNLRQLHQDAALVAQSHVVSGALDSAVATLVDAETGQRGFLITGDPSYLGPYEAALRSAGELFIDLDKAGEITPNLHARLPEFHDLVAEKLRELAVTIEMRKAGDVAGAQRIVLGDEGKRTMDRIRAVVGQFQIEQRTLLAEREQTSARAYRTAVAGIVISSLAGIGALVGLLLLVRRLLRSITQSAADLHQQRELLKAALVSIGDGVIVTDIQGRVNFLNTVAETLTGWTQAEAAGRNLIEVFQIVNETTRETVDNPSLRALREGKVVDLANHTILISKNGVEWPIDDSAAPITTEQGQVSGSVLVFREISQRKVQQASLLQQTAALQSANVRMNELVAELKDSEELFHSMVDSIPQLAWMTRPDGHIYWYNRRWYEYTGCTPEQMEGWGWQSVQDPAELPRVLTNWKAALAAGHAWEDTFPLRRHDGEMRWHLSRAEPLRNDQGDIVRWFGTNTDITERLAMEQALREADHRKDEFLATLAHELRNPIAPISNALQVWPLVENDREEVEKLRAIMDRQIRQMTRLIDDLLDVSRITRGKIQLRCQPVDLSTIISGAIEAIRPMIDAHAHHLEVVGCGETVMVDGDVARLTQAIGNLLQNAAKYTPREGQIRMAIEREAGQAVVRIADNGVGIPPHMLQQIFEMFQQVDQTLDRAHGGLGLGLTLVKRLVELHGGVVEAHSAGEGQGSEFVVRLPLFDASRQVAPPTHALGKRSNGLPRHRVLVVDDVYASAKTLAMMLESINQDVAIAHDGPSAIEQVAANRPDIMFLDIAMPGMSGYDVAQHLRKQAELGGICLVALTGYGHEEDRRKAIEAGFHHHLTKPASMDQLAQLLHTLPGGDWDGDSPGKPPSAGKSPSAN
jgi:PAS domain S-box-containing protein